MQDGSWACRHGNLVFDSHDLLENAIEHLTSLAAANPPAELIVHHLDGRIEGAGLV
jgi:Uncharacterized protein conserved in bacteria (DUF2188)